MKQFLFFISCLLMVSNALLASDIYKSVDKEGNVIFSDQPQKDSEIVEVEPVNIQKYEKRRPLPTSPRQTQKFTYKSLNITSPENGTTLRNTGDTVISGTLKPSLRSDHKVEFLDNGSPIKPAGKSLSFSVTNLSRGTHALQIRVIDAKGKALISSTPKTIHVHRQFISPTATPAAPTTPPAN